jgi:hypothetical protein
MTTAANAESPNVTDGLDWKKFLETHPPESTARVTIRTVSYAGGTVAVDTGYPLQLHCDSEECNGTHWFDHEGGTLYLESAKWKQGILIYRCRHCRRTSKAFGLYVQLLKVGEPIEAYKIGEYPPFGPPIPSRVIALVGGDRELFLKGRRAEIRGLGIGAFAYYRRVVENQKGRIIDEMKKVARRIGAKPEILEMFDNAQKESQFSKAIDQIKGAIPESLLIDGHNPLRLLHTALSEGLHADDDEMCLALAQSIRTILTELAERISLALKEQSELTAAVSRILQQRSKND